MTISSFILICILILVFTLAFCVVERTKLFPDIKDHDIINRKLSDRRQLGLLYKGVFFLLFAFLAFSAVWTAKYYVYPSKTADGISNHEMFTNTRYHVLAHDGYMLGKQFYLAHGLTTSSTGFPSEALWDNKDGVVKLNREDSTMTIQQFFEPIYVRKSEESRWSKDPKNTYHLQNLIIQEDVSGGFELKKNGERKFVLEIQRYVPSVWDKLTARDERLKEEQVFYITKLYISKDSCIRDTSSFNREIQQGYPLLDIIARSPRIELTEDLEQWFSDCYLVRQSIPLKGNVFGFNKKHPAPLRIMPGMSFFAQDSLTINDHAYDSDTTFVVRFSDYAYQDRMTFFEGVGLHRGEEFRLSYPAADSMKLEFLQKNMRQLREVDGRVFITSSVDEVSAEDREGGYLYNKFSDEKNFNHINATIRYKVGSARDSLCFSVLDLNNQLTGERHIYHSDETFLLHSNNKTDNAISWIFEVVNMRETNDLQMRHIIWFVILMLLAVTIRMGLDSWFELRSLSLFEYGLYVVLFGLGIVRLILAWRVSTFAPIEDISLPAYIKMRTSIYDGMFVLIWLLPIIVSVYAYVDSVLQRKGLDKIIEETIHNKWSCFCERALMWMRSRKFCIGAESATEFSITTILFIISLALTFLLGKMHVSLLERLCNIVFPVLIYFLADIWMEVRRERQNQNETSLTIRRLVHAFLLFCYLGVADAGFTIVLITFLLLFDGILKGLFNKQTNLRGWNRWRRYVISGSVVFLIYLLLRYEGDIMISIFKYPGWWGLALGVLMTALFILLYIQKHHKFFLGMAAVFVVAAALGVVDLMGKSSSPAESDQMFRPYTYFVNKKAHMRYRAEIQQLGKNETIDDIIMNSDYESGDIIYIMRSAHNQWFINQYIRAGQDMSKEGSKFRLQTHSNQGCTYTTQTTDLVVTRYIIAEHGEVVARRILELWVLLILIFIMEVMMSNGINVACTAGGLLVYAVSLLVYLSATNRIVFIGQDFPMISLQSRIAVLLPYILFCIPLFRSVYIRQHRVYDKDDRETDVKGVVYCTLLAVLTILCIAGIEQKGKEQEDSQFNVSSLISNVSDKVSMINDRFTAFQAEHRRELKKKRMVDVWKAFLEEDNYSYVYYALRDDLSGDNRFFGSALRYFENQQVKKTDVNQLLHLRRRGGTCYLSVNKRHYFIPAIMEEDMQWRGNLYAAQIDHNYTLFGLNTSGKITLDSQTDYEMNILSRSVSQQIPNMPLARFDSDWTPNDKPLLLIQSTQGDGQSEYFCIESDSLELKSSGVKNQIATALEPGDVFSLNYASRAGDTQPKTIYSAKLRKDGVNFIARNIWLNGHRRLFYPLGKQSMWTYHYANLVSSALCDTALLKANPTIQDSSLVLSIDYDLCKALYETIDNEAYENKSNRTISNKVRAEIEKFSEAAPTVQKDSLHNKMFYDDHRNVLVLKDRRNKELCTIVAKINKYLKEYSYAENRLSYAIDKVLQRPYDFTAVAIDGDGHIRALFDYTQRKRVDPNNIENLSKLISELYMEGSSADERDLFGSKALQHIPMGPGSSFKPVAYAAITSQEHLDWKTINVNLTGKDAALSKRKKKSASKVTQFRYYGGVDIEKEAHEPDLNIDCPSSGYEWNNYLIKSNNLYHSVMVMLGLQPIGEVTKVMRSTAGLTSQEAFPTFSYKGNQYAFNPEVWYRSHKEGIVSKNSILTTGLWDNFRIHEGANRVANRVYHNYFGHDSIMRYIYEYPSSARGWSYAEEGSQNSADRNQRPTIQNGFNRMLLGAYPLQQTPLQMAINAMRIVSLNRAENITTLLDGPMINDYEFFRLGAGWSEQSYLDLVREVVWSQMRKVPKEGTARGLSGYVNSIEKGKYGKPYYLYCKTGTLADERGNADKDRIKHLMVIITDSPLEQVSSLEKLKDVRYYVVYLSYFGVRDFSNIRYKPYIDKVMSSATFQSYMNYKK